MNFFKNKKFTLNAKFPKLNKVRERLGIDLKISDFIRKGSIELTSKEEFYKNVHFAPRKLNKIIMIAGKISVIYIKDNSNKKTSNPEDLTKIHLTECSTIHDMKSRNRFHRYIGVHRVEDDKKFTIAMYSGARRSKLHVCKNCLNQLNLDKSNENITNFDYENHINTYKSKINTFVLQYDDYNAPDYLYPPNWSEISKKIRRQHRYICSDCGVNLSQNAGLLDVHHKDSDKSNVNPINLECLCKLCHSQRHDHYTSIVAKEIQQIKSIQAKQGLNKRSS